MPSDIILSLFIMSIICLTIWGIITNPASSEEISEMLEDDEMWP